MQGALEDADGGVLVAVDVKPSADRDAFPDGYNEWRQRLGVRLEAPAREGQANRALCELVAKTLQVDSGNVGIRQGHTSSRKTVFVRGKSPEQVATMLGGRLDG